MAIGLLRCNSAGSWSGVFFWGGMFSLKGVPVKHGFLTLYKQKEEVGASGSLLSDTLDKCCLLPLFLLYLPLP